MRAHYSVVLLLSGLTSCADGGEFASGGAGQGGNGQGGERPTSAVTSQAATTHATSTSSGSGGAAGTLRMCPTDQFVTAIAADGTLSCSSVASIAEPVINSECSITVGWRDGCTACALPPSKWGRVSGTACSSGVGTHNTCSTLSLGGVTLELLGLNVDGDVDETDKFYFGFHCNTPAPQTSTGPCPSGALAIHVGAGDTLDCETASASITSTVGSACSIYAGWRDSCDGCTLTPSKWGSANDATCTNGLGAGNTCTTETLGGASVRLFGLDTDGDVDGNDVFYYGLRCGDVAEDISDGIMGPCPAGQYVTGIYADGSLVCRSPGALVQNYFEGQCGAWFGWRDSCDGCGLTPAKWGRVREGFCENGVGAQNTCTTPTLSGGPVSLLGLNMDGEVDGNDTFFTGFKCQ